MCSVKCVCVHLKLESLREVLGEGRCVEVLTLLDASLNTEIHFDQPPSELPE